MRSRLEGLAAGATRAISDDQVEQVIIKTLENTPRYQDTHWSTHSITEAMGPTTPARMAHDYVRHGTINLFAALDVASGSVIAQHQSSIALRNLKNS